MEVQCSVRILEIIVKTSNFYIAGFIPAYENIWFLSNDLGFNSFNKHYYLQLDDMNSYVRDHFDAFGFFSNNISYLDNSTPSRIRNLITGAIKDQKILPKLILVVPDSDILDYWHSKNL